MTNTDARTNLDFIAKYRKLFYLASMLCCSLLGIGTPVKLLLMLCVAVAVLLSPFKLRPLSEMKASEFVLSGVLVAVYTAVNCQLYTINFFLLLILSLYFLIHTIDQVYLIFSGLHIDKPSIGANSGKLSPVEIVISAITSVVVMLFYTTSSPLYPLNFWDDSNIFFTVGRGITKGIVPYRDVFDHKGPYLHFIHAISSYISDNSFLGVYCFEVIACFVFILFVWKTVHLFYSPNKSSLLLIPLGAILAYNVIPFHFGDSAEEFCFPLIAIVFFLACKAELNDTVPSPSQTMGIGLITGILFFTKFTFCGVILGYLIYIVIKAIANRILLIKHIVNFIIGFAITLVPIIVYFGVNGAINDFYTVYIHKNIFEYAGGTSSVKYMFDNISTLMSTSAYTFYGVMLSLISLIGLKREIRGMYALMIIFCAVSIFVPSTFFFYYLLILTALTIPAYILISVMWDRFVTKLSCMKFRFDIIAYLAAIAILVVSFMSQRNLVLINKPVDEIPQYVFSSIIKSNPNSKVLAYDVNDAGFFLCADKLPSTKYYCDMVASDYIPEYKQTQNYEIDNHEFDYIITLSNEYNWDGYEIIATAQFHADENIQISIDDRRDFTYYLYAQK